MLSPANTYVCLTEGGPGCADDEPDKYYPSGARNYARVVANDAYQGAAVAQFAQEQGTTKLFILNDKEAYGLGVATNVQGAAEFLGIEVVGFEAWDPKASNYEATHARRSRADPARTASSSAASSTRTAAQVIKDKVKVLGPNDGDVKLYMPDGFTTQQTIDESGVENTQDAFFSIAGVPTDEFESEAAQTFVADVQDESRRRAGRPVRHLRRAGGPGHPQRDRSSDGTRPSVIEQMFATECTGCFLGDFTFNENGDPTLASGAVVGFTIYRGQEELETETVFSPSEDAVNAARRALAAQSGDDSGEGLRPSPGSIRGSRTMTVEAETREPLARSAESAGVSRPSVLSIIGLVFVGLVALVLAAELHRRSAGVHQRHADRHDDRLRVRHRRARLHARLRDPAADQLRPRRRVRALGARSRARS